VRPTRRAVLGAPLLLALPHASAPADTYASLLAEEHAAIWLYGVLAPRLPDVLAEAARAAYDDHRRHRDLLAAAIRAAGGTPPAPKPAYGLPFALATADAARRLAIRVEDSLALRWHAAVGVVSARDRAQVAGALADEAGHLAMLRWSVAHHAADAAQSFPGR
jgi:hypothetical protein